MRNRFLIAGILAVMLVVSSFDSADAHGWGRWRCRPHRVFIAPPVPRVVVPVVVPRVYHHRSFVYYSRPRYNCHRGYGRWGRHW